MTPISGQGETFMSGGAAARMVFDRGVRYDALDSLRMEGQT
jgi:hypothetical protein